MNESNNLRELRVDGDSEISLVDIMEFIKESWKPILGAGILGAAIGLGSWFALTDHKAEFLMQNNGGFDIISWRSTEKALSNLAAEMLEKKAVPDNQVPLFRKISSPTWWSKNVQVNYALTKKDIKDIPVVSKDFDGAAATILSFTIAVSSSSEAKALNEASETVQFLVNGNAYIAIKNLLNNFEINSLTEVPYVQQKISATEIELYYLRKRAKSLELLQNRYPSATNVTNHMFDLKEEGAKYLPLSTQIIAINSDINANKETLDRLNDQLNHAKTLKAFLDGALPFMDGRYDASAIVKELLVVEEKLRAKISPGDIKAIKNLDFIRFQLINIEINSKRLLQNITYVVGKSGSMLKNIAGGFLIASSLILAFLLGRKALRKLKF